MIRFQTLTIDAAKRIITEYDNFYLASVKNSLMEPIMFSKKSGLPVPKSFASIPLKDCKNPKLIYDGGKDNGKE